MNDHEPEQEPEDSNDFFQKTVIQACDKAASDLYGIVDSVQIFVTYQNGSQSITESYNTGKGNFYARMGQIREWTLRQDQYVLTDADRDQKKNYNDEE